MENDTLQPLAGATGGAELYRLLADNSTDIIARLTPEGVCTYISPSWKRVLGYDPEEALGKNLIGYFHPDDMPNFLQARDAIRSDGKRTFLFNTRILKKDGDYLWMEAAGEVFFNAAGVPSEVQVTIRDISERKHAEDELKRSLEAIHDLYDHAPCGYHTLDMQGCILRMNDTELSWLGYLREEVVGKLTISDILTESAMKEVRQKLKAFLRTGKALNMESELRRKDGTVLPVLVNATILRSEEGRPSRVRVTLFDITERKAAEEALRVSEEQYRVLTENSTDIISRTDASGRFIYVSPGVSRAGYDPQELLGKKVLDFIHADDQSQMLQLNYGFYRTRLPATVSWRFKRKDGTWVWLETVIRPVFDKRGRIVEQQSSARDITERKQAEAELKAYRERLDIVLKNIDAFVCQLDSSGIFTLAEGRALGKLGIPQSQIIGHQAVKVHGSNAMLKYAIRQAISGRRTAVEFTVNDTVMEGIYSPYMGVDGTQDGVIGLAVDITERKRAEQNLNAEKERLRVTLQSIGDGVIATDADGMVAMMNPVAEQLTGWPTHRAVGRPFGEIFDVYNETTGEKCATPVERVLSTGDVVGLGNHMALRAADGTVRSISDSAAPILDASRRILGAILVFRDVTEAKKKESEITYLSYHDVLTGLYNRTFFEEEARRLDTERQLPISIIMGDVNGLKLTNDVFGHTEGDGLLVRITQILRECCRNEDIVARIGGDEYCILLPKTSYAAASDICKRIYTRCEKADLGQQKSTAKLSISLGFATKTSPGESLSNVMKAAEDLMYRRKLLESRSQHSFLISSIRATLFEKSYETEQHAQRLIANSKAIASALNLPDDQLNDIELFALLHDIGKIAIDGHILTKTEQLTEEEWAELRRHPEIGFRIAQSSPDLAHIAEYILCHHERWDGTGYPQGLKGTAIPLLARIMLVVDSWDAMTQDRVYRRAMSREDACAELLLNAGKQFDPNIVWVFLDWLQNTGMPV